MTSTEEKNLFVSGWDCKEMRIIFQNRDCWLIKIVRSSLSALLNLNLKSAILQVETHLHLLTSRFTLKLILFKIYFEVQNFLIHDGSHEIKVRSNNYQNKFGKN